MFTRIPVIRTTVPATAMLAMLPFLLAGAAAAQSVGNVRGSVLVNHGSGFLAITAPTPLRIGDTVMARTGGSATLVYADGCKVDVIPGTVLTLENVSPCSIVNAVDPSSPALAQNNPPNGNPPPTAIPPTYFGLGAIAAVGAAGLTVGLSNNNSSTENPASP